LPKPRRLRRFSISDARFALFNIKRDIATWYDLRLAGCVRDEKCELTFVRIADALWEKKVPAKVNAEIRKRIEADTAKTKLLRRAYSWCREESTFAWKKFREGFYSEGGKSTYKHVVTVCFAVVVGIITFVVKYSDRLIDFILRK
jgi:hypothetical protein